MHCHWAKSQRWYRSVFGSASHGVGAGLVFREYCSDAAELVGLRRLSFFRVTSQHVTGQHVPG
jgi:hypothetical protein